MHKVRTDTRGISLIELIVTLTILSILVTLILPSVQMTSKRTKELELKRDLRTIRTAIDDFKKSSEKIAGPPPSGLSTSGYPKTLGQLAEGTDFGDVNGVKKKFLRKIPVDPFHPVMKDGVPEWGLRSYSDSPDSTLWGGEDVYDVYSLSEDTAIDGSKYKDW
jgi:general secretion pathway protein G